MADHQPTPGVGIGRFLLVAAWQVLASIEMLDKKLVQIK
jgi:hypothetical protein